MWVQEQAGMKRLQGCCVGFGMREEGGGEQGQAKRSGEGSLGGHKHFIVSLSPQGPGCVSHPELSACRRAQPGMTPQTVTGGSDPATPQL